MICADIHSQRIDESSREQNVMFYSNLLFFWLDTSGFSMLGLSYTLSVLTNTLDFLFNSPTVSVNLCYCTTINYGALLWKPWHIYHYLLGLTVHCLESTTCYTLYRSLCTLNITCAFVLYPVHCTLLVHLF